MVKTERSNGALFQDDDEEVIDQQELLVEVSHLRAQLKNEKDKTVQAEEENAELKLKVAVLEGQNSQLVEALRRFEEEAREAEKFVHKQMNVKEEGEMEGLKEGDEGYFEAKCKVLEKRMTAIAKNDYWLRAVRSQPPQVLWFSSNRAVQSLFVLQEVEQAKDQAADARRRQVDAERFLGELLRDRTDLYHQMSRPLPEPSGELTGSAIFQEEKAFVEGLPKTIPSRAQRAAGLITALGNSATATLRGTVGRTVVTQANHSTVGPSARPGNVWATLMNGGAAGKVDFT
mmetsp:Transcript_52660/g.105490  ORF Transcript_52660/g.105490 Transcript_52660/m.105490 type:complete len:288 (-) Transcript_52660:132-995(-)